MNKWLSEIEIFASNHFGEKNCRQFVDETRPLVDGVYDKLKRNIKSRYGKVVVILMPQSVLDEFSAPSHAYDTMGGVCMIYHSYDLNDYLNEDDQASKNEIVYNILKETYENMPDEVGLERDLIIGILTDVYNEIQT